ncbi:MAG: site-2 protease family protein [bacterium]|nr:site-2 protease family protein [bacterium]
MLSLLFSNPLAFFILFPGLLLSITVHEFAHALAADKLGDPTPRQQGRVTLNPLAHLDPLGTLAMLLTRFGWGRPVQFDPYNLKNPLRDTALIALAGPVSNVVIALVLTLLVRTVFIDSALLTVVASQIIGLNIILALFNLVPVYPLDGSKILLALLPRNLAYEYESFMNRYGIFVLLLLIFPWAGGMSPVSQLISPLINTVMMLLLG